MPADLARVNADIPIGLSILFQDALGLTTQSLKLGNLWTTRRRIESQTQSGIPQHPPGTVMKSRDPNPAARRLKPPRCPDPGCGTDRAVGPPPNHRAHGKGWQTSAQYLPRLPSLGFCLWNSSRHTATYVDRLMIGFSILLPETSNGGNAPRPEIPDHQGLGKKLPQHRLCIG